MISEKSQNLSELAKMVSSSVSRYCYSHALPSIRVFIVTSIQGYAHFNFVRVHIQIPSNLPNLLRRETQYNRVWILNEAVGHEMTHYKQYLRMVKRGELVTKDKFDEDEAKLEGKLFADKAMKYYSKETINPQNPKRGNSNLLLLTALTPWPILNPVKMITVRKDKTCFDCRKTILKSCHAVNVYGKYYHVDCYKKAVSHNPIFEAFHGVKPTNVRKVDLPMPKGGKVSKIGDLVSLVYKVTSKGKLKDRFFEHKLGDTGSSMKKDKPVLASDGKNLFIIPDKANPTFTERGIIG